MPVGAASVADTGIHVEKSQLGVLEPVDHEPRVHLDIETDDREAECERLKALGAKEVARIKTWIVMEAPTGQRFCIVQPQSSRFASDANRWE